MKILDLVSHLEVLEHKDKHIRKYNLQYKNKDKIEDKGKGMIISMMLGLWAEMGSWELFIHSKGFWRMNRPSGMNFQLIEG